MTSTPWNKQNERPFRAGYRKMLNREFILPNGKTYDFDIKHEGPAVCILPVTKQKTIIVAAQFRPGPEKMLNELPGGGVDNGESAQEAAERELLEETGYQGTVTFIGTCYDDAYSTMLRHCFVATDCVKIQEPQLDEKEFVSVHELSLEEFRKLLRSGEMTDVEVGYLGLEYLKLL